MNRTLIASLILVLALIGSFVFLAPPQAPSGSHTTRGNEPSTSVVASTPTSFATTSSSAGPTPVLGYQIVKTYPHDKAAYTQGLIFADGALYESTGLYGKSTLRKVDLETGKVLQMVPIPDQYFGEGITLWQDKLVYLTWRENTGFTYDVKTFDLVKQFTYPTEGWGITHDGRRLIMSDGSSTLYFLNPQTLQQTGSIQVREHGVPVIKLNELEYIHGKIYANVWQTDRIAIISPDSGQIEQWVDLTGLLGPEFRTSPVDFLNGIAYDAKQGRLYVTGKLWPVLFEIRLVPSQNS